MFRFGGPDCRVCRLIRVYLLVAIPVLMMMDSSRLSNPKGHRWARDSWLSVCCRCRADGCV